MLTIPTKLCYNTVVFISGDEKSELCRVSYFQFACVFSILTLLYARVQSLCLVIEEKKLIAFRNAIIQKLVFYHKKILYKFISYYVTIFLGEKMTYCFESFNCPVSLIPGYCLKFLQLNSVT